MIKVLNKSDQLEISCLSDNQGAGNFLKNYDLFIKIEGNPM
jgi:hypothetical protein